MRNVAFRLSSDSIRCNLLLLVKIAAHAGGRIDTPGVSCIVNRIVLLCFSEFNY